MKFNQWLKENHPETFEEGLGKKAITATLLGLGTGLGIGHSMADKPENKPENKPIKIDSQKSDANFLPVKDRASDFLPLGRGIRGR